MEPAVGTGGDHYYNASREVSGVQERHRHRPNRHQAWISPPPATAQPNQAEKDTPPRTMDQGIRAPPKSCNATIEPILSNESSASVRVNRWATWSTLRRKSKTLEDARRKLGIGGASALSQRSESRVLVSSSVSRCRLIPCQYYYVFHKRHIIDSIFNKWGQCSSCTTDFANSVL